MLFSRIKIKEISFVTAEQLLKEGALMVDVREPEEVADIAYNVKEIINIPISEFKKSFNKIPKDRKVILACHSGSRSYTAAGFLIKQGYDSEKIASLKGGIIDWLRAGMPVTPGI